MILGVGVDIVEIERVRDKPSLWKRFLSQKELLYLEKFKFKGEHVAGFWAAKEALVKALNDATVNFREISILHDEEGKPFFEGLKADGFFHLSISHEKKFAVALVIWESG